MQVREEAERPRTPLVAFFSILLKLCRSDLQPPTLSLSKQGPALCFPRYDFTLYLC